MQGDILADEMLDMAKMVIHKPSLASAIRVAADILQWQAGIRDSKYNSKVAPDEKKRLPGIDDMRKEVAKLEFELGVKGTPGMNTAKRYTPPPAPNSENGTKP